MATNNSCLFFFPTDRLKTVPRILHFTLFLQQEVRKLDHPFYMSPVWYSILPIGKAGEQFTPFVEEWEKRKKGGEGVLEEPKIRYPGGVYNTKKKFACWPNIQLSEW